MKRWVFLLGVIAGCFTIGVWAQGRNFDGKWTLDTAMSGGAGGGGGRGQASDFTIKMDAKTFAVSTWRGDVETVMTYKMDGSDSYNKPAGRNQNERTYRFAWDGDKAVITSKTADGEERLQYSLQGDTLVRAVTRTGAQPTDVRTYFKRAK